MNPRIPRPTLMLVALAALCAAPGCVKAGASGGSASDAGWQSLLPGLDPSSAAVAGQWRKSGGELSVGAAQGARLRLPIQPPAEYDLRISFTRRSGRDSIGAVVVQNGRQVVFEVDAWGSHLAGFQDVGGRTIRDNSTRREGYALENGRRYTLTVEVRRDLLRGLLDGREVSAHRTNGSDLAVHGLWRLPDNHSLGLVAWDSETLFHSVEMRPLSDSGARPAAPRPAPRPAVAPPAPRPSGESPRSGGAGKRVLIVIANYHFFFREYADPRAELERAGHQVTVAAGRRGSCVPHQGSGEPGGGGVVQAQIALGEVRAADYDAILFSGGWGASAYQFAFPGRYDDPQYNGDPAIKREANRLINEFTQQDKYVAALCNGVSVLAWARVNGRSPLQGKRVCAPVRAAASGIYNGRHASPPCRWHPEANGAVMSPPGVLGRPGTAADDVMVDGKILTGEDDISAREMGRQLVRVLSR